MHLKSQYQDLYNSSAPDVKARLSLMYGNALGGLLVTFLCMCVLCFAFEDLENQQTKLYIFIAFLLSHTLRLIDNIYTRIQYKNDTLNINTVKWRFTAGILTNSIIWATYSFLFVPIMGSLEITIAAIIFSALAGGAITILAGSTSLSIFYMSCLLLPFAIAGFNSKIEYFHYISYLGFVFWFVMFITAFQVGKFFTHVLALQSENAKMLKMTALEKKETERMNQALSKANSKLDNYAYELESEVEKRTDEILRLSNIDPLTNLLNRAAFSERIARILSHASNRKMKYALLFIDLNGFKDVNDGFGHKVGDSVLSEIALRLGQIEASLLESSTTFEDTPRCLLCRWGGDEFLFLCESAQIACVDDIVEQIHKDVAEPIYVSSNIIHLNASIGISKFPLDSEKPIDLIQYADIAMYHHKKARIGQAVHFTPALFNEFQHDQIIRDGLKGALLADEFTLVFQPIMDIEANKPWAFEALLRWKHNGLVISPDEFIPIAEKAGHILQIGAWVLKTACAHAATWQFNYASVSINVSASQLLDIQFISVIEHALESSGLAPERLHLEITESVMLEEGELVSLQLERIAHMGIHISIDDFGTGYSSLNQLQVMSFDVIKIDRSFLKGLTKKDQTIIAATKLIADEFNAATVAEGIETEQELATLKGMGIRYIQGFLFARPMSPVDLKQWYEQQHFCKD